MDLAEADAVSFRMPFQSEGACREAINDGRIEFHDEHLSHCSQQLLEGFFGAVDVAVIEASEVTDDGRVYFTTAIGNGPTFLRMADKVIIEINRRHPPARLRVQRHPAAAAAAAPRSHCRSVIRSTASGCPTRPSTLPRSSPSWRPTRRAHARAPRPPDPGSRRIAEHLVRFFRDEIAAGRLPARVPPAAERRRQRRQRADRRPRRAPRPAAVHDVHARSSRTRASTLMRAGRLTGASACALTLSEGKLQEVYDDLAFFEPRIVLRPQELSNHPTVIRQLGVIATNTAMEIDIYGHVNSTHVCGTQLMNGLGGAGDFERNARLSVFVCHSTAKGGRVSSIVPFCSHVDHSEHSVHVDRDRAGPRRPARPGAGRARAADHRQLRPPGLSRLPAQVHRGRASGPHPPRPGALLRAAPQPDRARGHAARPRSRPVLRGAALKATDRRCGRRGAAVIDEKLSIRDDFPPVGYDAWKAKAEADLKGASFERRLVGHTEDGIALQPLSTAGSWPSAGDPSGFPGSLPFTRGMTALGRSVEGWDVRREVIEPEPAAAREIVLGELSAGRDLHRAEAGRRGLRRARRRRSRRRRPVRARRADGVQPRRDGPGAGGRALRQLARDPGRRRRVSSGRGRTGRPLGGARRDGSRRACLDCAGSGAPGSGARGAFNADPLGALLRDGSLPVSLEAALEQMADLAVWTAAHLPAVTAVRVSTSVYHDAGSSSVQDLAFALATAVQYLRAMTAAGLDP